MHIHSFDMAAVFLLGNLLQLFFRRARSAHLGWGSRGAAAEKSLKFVRRISPAGGAWSCAGSGLVLEYYNGIFRLKVTVEKALSDECVWVCSACRLTYLSVLFPTALADGISMF